MCGIASVVVVVWLESSIRPGLCQLSLYYEHTVETQQRRRDRLQCLRSLLQTSRGTYDTFIIVQYQFASAPSALTYALTSKKMRQTDRQIPDRCFDAYTPLPAVNVNREITKSGYILYTYLTYSIISYGLSYLVYRKHM